MKKLALDPIWISSSKAIPMKDMEDNHIVSCYWWACKRYTKYHNEYVHAKFENSSAYQNLYTKLRELELEACKRGLKLNIPDINLIKRDIKFYWKDAIAEPNRYLKDTNALTTNTVARIKNIAQLS